MKRFVRSMLLILILSVSGFIGSAYTQITMRDFTVAEIFNSKKFVGETLRRIHWKKDGSQFIYNEEDKKTGMTNFMGYELATGKRKLYVESNMRIEYDVQVAHRFKNNLWSPDENYILLTGTLPARRVKTGGNFYLYDIKAKELRQLTDTDKNQVNVKFSPDGKLCKTTLWA